MGSWDDDGVGTSGKGVLSSPGGGSGAAKDKNSAETFRHQYQLNYLGNSTSSITLQIQRASDALAAAKHIRPLSISSISCRRWTLATRCLMRIVLCVTELDDHCNKLDNVEFGTKLQREVPYI